MITYRTARYLFGLALGSRSDAYLPQAFCYKEAPDPPNSGGRWWLPEKSKPQNKTNRPYIGRAPP